MLGEAVEGRFQLVHGDILDIKEEEVLGQLGLKSKKWESDSQVVLIGNLPFGIATPLYIKWLRQISQRSGVFGIYGRVEMILMFQKEVGDRIIAQPSSEDYSRLSVISQNFCTVERLAIVKGKTFVPPPKVDGMMVRIVPRKIPLINVSMELLEEFCKVVFGKRRKTMESTLRRSQFEDRYQQIPEEFLKKRAQELSALDIARLALFMEHVKDAPSKGIITPPQ